MSRFLITLVLMFIGAVLSTECQIISYQQRAYAQQGQDGAENAPPILSNSQPSEQHRGAKDESENAAQCAAHSVRQLWEETVAKPEAFWAAMVAFITLALVASTIFLWLSTRKLAQTAARALIELERPFVYVEVTERGFATMGEGHLGSPGRLIYQCVNLGRTPADVWDISEDVIELDRDKWPDPVIPSRQARTMPPGIVVGPDKPYVVNYDLRNRFGDRTRGVNGVETNVFFIGYVRYADIFGNRYVTGFCAIHDPVSWQFVLRGDERYNYTKPEKRTWWRFGS